MEDESLRSSIDNDWFYTRGVFETPIDQLIVSSMDSRVFDNFRHSRSGRILVISTTLLTQVVVLAVVAMIMGVAVTTMCTVLGEIAIVITVATALERELITFADLATILEVAATILATGITIFLASTGAKLAGDNIQAAKFV